MTKRRFSYTDEEHEKLSRVGTEFCQDLAKIAAKALVQFDPSLFEAVYMYLQDQTSLYSPYTAERIVKHVMRKRRAK